MTKTPRLTWLPWFVWALVVAVSILLPLNCAQGAPFARATSDAGVTIDLDTDNCKLQEHVISLPKRVTWTEKGKVIEGCFGIDRNRALVIMYFEDKTIIILDVGVFSRLVTS